MSNRTEARSAKAARMHATGRLPLLRLFSTPLKTPNRVGQFGAPGKTWGAWGAVHKDSAIIPQNFIKSVYWIRAGNMPR